MYNIIMMVSEPTFRPAQPPPPRSYYVPSHDFKFMHTLLPGFIDIKLYFTRTFFEKYAIKLFDCAELQSSNDYY